MCGIAGGLQLSQRQQRSMLKSMKHRGPDGSGEFHSGDFAIGMVRLAILDPQNGQQPFISSDRRVHAVYNGEIYNWKEIRRELQSLGHQFHTQCDGEILPASWMEWREGMFAKLEGMFAIALHDQLSNELFFARDRCGQKPLYFTTMGTFKFASEIRALRAAGVNLVPNSRYLSQWLSLRYVAEPATLFEGIETLPSGCWGKVNTTGNIQIQRYWEPPVATPQDKRASSLSESIDRLDILAHASVEKALQVDSSNTQIGIYLSSGVDSALLAKYARDSGAAVTSMSIGFGSDSDETQKASQYAQSLGISHHCCHLEPNFLSNLPRVIAQMERPVGDALILAFDKLASETSSLGCKVVLGGEGPDEYFAGYSFQKASLRTAALSNSQRSLLSLALQLCPQMILNRMAAFPAHLGKTGKAKVVDYVRRFHTLSVEEKALELRTLYTSKEIENYLTHTCFDTQHSRLPQFSFHSEVETEYSGKLDQWLDFTLSQQYSTWLPDWSLIRQDKNTMAHSVEYRAPFLDHAIIDFAFSLPDSFKMRKGQDKFLWRKLAQRHLPRSITQRKKQPFYLPLEQPAWRKQLLEMAHDVLSSTNYSCHGFFRPEAVRALTEQVEFLPLKKLASILILHLWLDEINRSS